VQAPIGDGALVHPGPEHGADRAPQLLMRGLGCEIASSAFRLRGAGSDSAKVVVLVLL
jgi:hypothetical protein